MKTSKYISTLCSLIIAAGAWATDQNIEETEAAAGGGAAQANNPLANTTSVNFQNYYIGEFTGVNRDANQFLMRVAQPFKVFSTQWIARATLPLNTYPNGNSHTTGLGDFNIFAAYLFDMDDPTISFGVGPQFTFPTATDSVLGAEKWSAGLANVLFNAKSKFVQYGYLLTWQASFAGDSSRSDVNAGAFQPFVFLQLGEGWYLRSTGVMVYDFENDDYAVPLGLGVGKVIPTESVVYNVFIEPQYSVADSGRNFPEWQIFAGFNMQF